MQIDKIRQADKILQTWIFISKIKLVRKRGVVSYFVKNDAFYGM